ncbi:MAG: MerR family transcriptional regulator [Bacillota bacterium]|jgi:chromosome-anchoring protein RacA|uniref:MerR family transcriptional regulator n=1 Tax=Bacillus sp. RO2 TaxID=2723913 RepID=UPI00145C5221|nr:MerR family transcriptional regulator [Bacillus sp. RO2]MEA3322443.1 MerR family transcriptional regulator [Bacillota bacterium]NMH72581.1 MerR family transcriptional regulator [Bacillus sp. RO2]
MELKTHEVAKELGMAPRTVRKWVQKYEIPCRKNDYGHYVYDEEALARLETLKANSEVAGALDVEFDTDIKEVHVENMNVRSGKSKAFDHQLVTLTERVSRTEQMIQQKADEVVSYQLLQQRKEIEELTKKVDRLESMLDKLQAPVKKMEPPLIFDQPPQQKRRNVFRSIFGL